MPEGTDDRVSAHHTDVESSENRLYAGMGDITPSNRLRERQPDFRDIESAPFVLIAASRPPRWRAQAQATPQYTHDAGYPPE